MIPKLTMIATLVLALVLMMFSTRYTPQAQGTVETQAAPKALTPVPGDVLGSEDVQFIDQPGRYGLGSDLPGSRYAIVGHHLIRIDPETMQVQSILRNQALAATDR